MRAYDDESKIKIHHDYKKGNCIFKILDAWNQNDYRIRLNAARGSIFCGFLGEVLFKSDLPGVVFELVLS